MTQQIKIVKEPEMLKRTISLGELIMGCIVIIGAVLTFWISTNVRLSALEIYQQNAITNSSDTKAALKTIGDKLDKLNDGQNDIKVSLQNKQDRK